MLLADRQIRQFSTGPEWLMTHKPMIEPFSEAVSGNGVISYGLSSGGYDLRLAGELLIFKNSFGEIIDPKAFRMKDYEWKVFDKLEMRSELGQSVILPAHSYALGKSFEYLRIPKSIKGRCVGKSTWARCGLLVNTT